MALGAVSEGGRVSMEEFLLKLSARTPAPAGGAAGAYSVAIGAALCLMVLRFGASKSEKASKSEETTKSIGVDLERVAELSARAVRLAQEDEASYQSVLSAFRSSKALDPTEASEVKRNAFVFASRIPSECAKTALQVCDVVMSQVDSVSSHLVGDLIAAGLTAVSGGLVGAQLVIANLGDTDSELVDQVQRDLSELLGVQSALLKVLGDKRSVSPLWDI